jgi:uncharacterized repeat protein (TIGR03803 family)
MAANHVWFSSRLIVFSLAGFFSLAASASGRATDDSTLYSFHGKHDGRTPMSDLVSDSAGNLYGTTHDGGNCCGTVFRVTPNGKEKILYAFHGTDGAEPAAGVVLGAAGNIYGTTAGGGAYGFGTIFKLAPNGTETVLYSFKGGSDGVLPDSSLIIDSGGTLYGTTAIGGGSANCQNGCGTVFKLTADGTETVLHAFQGGSDGWDPRGSLARDDSGNLYGSTWAGGGSTECGDFGCGTVFKVASDGSETLLHTFQGDEGSMPLGGIMLDNSGNLYGTTSGGGATGAGTIFRLAPDNTETILYSFQGGHDDGVPLAGLIMDKRGNLYGTASQGGGTEGCHDFGCGYVFKLTSNGKKTILLSFDKKNGIMPQSSLLLGKNDELYGTTQYGGEHKRGVVFQVKK